MNNTMQINCVLLTHDCKLTFALPCKLDFALLWNSLHWYIVFSKLLIIIKTKVHCWLSKNHLTLLLHWKYPQFLQYCKHISLFWLSLPSESLFLGNTPGYYIPFKVWSLEIDSGLSSAEESKNMNTIALLLLKNIYP